MADDLARLREMLAARTPLNWVITGDSITHGLKHTQNERSYADHLHELVRGDLARVQDVMIDTAISGWRVVQLLEDFDRRVAAWHPHVVTVMIGTNDCNTQGAYPAITAAGFAASLTVFVRRVRALGAIPVLQTQPAIDTHHAPERARIAEFAQAVRDVAAIEKTVLVDHFARFTALGAGSRGGIPWGMLNDPFHPNGTGHAALALELAETIGIQPPPANDRVLPHLRARVTAGRA